MNTAAVIGLDFDNTLVAYDAVFHRLAVEQQLIGDRVPPNKRRIRDAIRQRSDGEREWQQLQAQAYGPLMTEAAIMPGVLPFLAACLEQRLPVYVISHRTERASLDVTGTNLRDVAFDWMRAHGFFGTSAFGLAEPRVFFESTRAEKVARIATVGCTHFVDDLEEVFLEPSFPSAIVQMLYAPDRQEAAESAPPAGVQLVTSWAAVHEVIFGRR